MPDHVACCPIGRIEPTRSVPLTLVAQSQSVLVRNVHGIAGYRFINGAWSNLGPRSSSLGSSGCQVKLYWSAEAA
jgi:hypothetical protein